MTDAHDKSDDAEAGVQPGARRAPWQRPIVRKLQTDDAQLSVTHSAADGTFTTS